MRKDTISDYIDKRILDLITYKSPCEVREVLREKCEKFSKNISVIDNASENNIKDIKDSREKYLNYYIFYAEKRIKQLYEIEVKDIMGLSFLKKFKLIILKENLSGVSNNLRKFKN